MRIPFQNTRTSFNSFLKKEEGAKVPNKKANELRLLKLAAKEQEKEERQNRANTLHQKINETVTRPMQNFLPQLIRLRKQEDELFRAMGLSPQAFSDSGKSESERSYDHVRSQIDTLERSWSRLMGQSTYLRLQFRG